MSSSIIINGDIGGTNARMQMWRLAIVNTVLTSSSPSTSADTRSAPNNDDNLTLVHDIRYPSQQFSSLFDLTQQFLIDCKYLSSEEKESSQQDMAAVEVDNFNTVIDAICLAICGPVQDEIRSVGPKLPEQGPTGWGADINILLSKFGGKIKQGRLINDFVAVNLIALITLITLVTL